MEDGFEIIIYLLIVALSIIGPLLKKLRENKKNEPSGKPTESPWDGIWGTDNDIPKEYSLPPHPPVTVIVTPPTPEPPAFRQMVAPKQLAVSRAQSADDGKARTQDIKLKAMMDSEGGRTTHKKTVHQEIHHTEEEKHEIEFDLRKAVIYSEILKPKYNEY